MLVPVDILDLFDCSVSECWGLHGDFPFFKNASLRTVFLEAPWPVGGSGLLVPLQLLISGCGNVRHERLDLPFCLHLTRKCKYRT